METELMKRVEDIVGPDGGRLAAALCDLDVDGMRALVDLVLDRSERVAFEDLLLRSLEDRSLLGHDSESVQRIGESVRRSFEAAKPRSIGRVVLAAWLQVIMRDAWERMIDLGNLRRVADVVLASVSFPAESDTSELAQLVRRMMFDIEVLVEEFEVEHAMNSGSAERTIEGCDTVLSRQMAAALPSCPSFEEVDKEVRRASKRDIAYYSAIRNSARIQRFIAEAWRRGTEMDPLARQLADEIHELAEDEAVADDADVAGELRALARSADQALEVAERERLRIHEGRLCYLYPFTFTGAAEVTLEAIKSHLDSDPTGPMVSHRRPSDVWAGFTTADKHFLSVDANERTHASAGTGLVVRLGPVDIAGLELDTELMLSAENNHLVRFSCEINSNGNTPLEPDDLHRLMRLAEASAALQPASVDEAEQLGLADVKAVNLALIAERIGDWILDKVRSVASLCPADRVRRITMPEAESHVLLTVRAFDVRATRDTGHAAWNSSDWLAAISASERELPIGANFLCSGIPRDAGTPLGWADTLSSEPTLVEGALSNELIISNGSSTVIIAPDSGGWLVHEHEEISEFVATLPPLIVRWRDEVDARLQSQQERLRAAQTGSASAEDSIRVEVEPGVVEIDANRTARELIGARRDQISLRELVLSARRHLAHLSSDEITKTSNHRLQIDQLMSYSPMEWLVPLLESRFELVTEMSGQLEALAEIEHDVSLRQAEMVRQHELKRFELAVGVVSALFAVFGVADVLGLFDKVIGWQSRWLAALELGIIAVLVVVVLLYVPRVVGMRLRDLWK